MHHTNGRLVDPKNGYRCGARRLHRRGQDRRDRRGAGRAFAPTASIDAIGLRRRARAWSTSRRGCASRASSTRRRSNPRCCAAVAGGVTSLACPPDTDPPLDEPGLVEMLKHRARSLNLARVYPVGALTAKLEGERLTEMAELRDAGCVAFSQAERRSPTRRCCGARCSTPRPSASRSGCGRRIRISRKTASRTTARSPRASACRASRRSPRPSRSPRSCSWCAPPARACTCAGSRRAEGVAMVRAAKREGLPVTCDVSVHHLHLSRNRHRLLRLALPPGAAVAQPARPRRAARRARRRHDRRGLLRPHAGRRGREAAAVRRIRAGRDRAGAAAAAHAQVGRRRRAAARCRRSRASTCEPARFLGVDAGASRRRCAGRPLRLRSRDRTVTVTRRRAAQPGQEHALPRLRAAGRRALHAGARPASSTRRESRQAGTQREQCGSASTRAARRSPARFSREARPSR